MVLSRPCHPDDQFTTSILRHWCMKHDELLAEHIKSLLIKNNSLPRKRQRWEWPLWDPPGQAAAVHRPSPEQPMLSLSGLWVTPSGLMLHGKHDYCGPFPSFPSALCLVPILAHLPDPTPPLPTLCPLPVWAASVFRRDPGVGECLALLEPSLGAQNLVLVTSLQPEELQQQAGPADSGADPGALGQPASQPDQH